MDWPRLGAVLHTTGLWGKSYLGVGRRAASRTWQKLCHREDTGLPWGKPYHGRIHIWDYPKGNQAIRTPSPVQGLTGDPSELTPVLGLASDCSAQSDCRGYLEDSRPGSQDNVRVDRPEHKALFAYRKRLEVPDPFDGSERGQERCLKRQEFQLDWVQRLKGAPLKSSQDDREVPRGHKGRPGGIHPPGPLQEPHDEIMLSQGPAVHCIVVSRNRQGKASLFV